MGYDLSKLLPQLHRHYIIDWLPEMKAGRRAYDFILAAVNSGGLSLLQLRNALHARFRLRSHANDQEVFDIYVRFSQHPNQDVRSTAVKLGLGVWRMNRQCPLQPLKVFRQDLAVFRRAVEVGVEPHIAELADAILRIIEP